VLNDFWFIGIYPIVVGWAFYRIEFKDFHYLEVIMFLPLALIILGPLGAIFILLGTGLSVGPNGIVQKNLFRETRISWQEVVSIEKKHLFAILPDLSDPEDVEIRDNEKHVIRVYRFLGERDSALNDIKKYSNKEF
jgi:hypothetical protein